MTFKVDGATYEASMHYETIIYMTGKKMGDVVRYERVGGGFGELMEGGSVRMEEGISFTCEEKK